MWIVICYVTGKPDSASHKGIWRERCEDQNYRVITRSHSHFVFIIILSLKYVLTNLWLPKRGEGYIRSLGLIDTHYYI